MLCVGIDLGTTRLRVAVARMEGGAEVRRESLAL